MEIKFWDDLTEEQQNEYVEEVSKKMPEAFFCSESWSAWQTETMTEWDFDSTKSNNDWIWNIAGELYNLSISVNNVIES